MTVAPVLNITMPVFNRYESTQRALLALRHSDRAVPFSITAVDNGSDPELVRRLIELKHAGIIDKLFLLERNYGTSCACNLGWKMTDARFYMKLDNDVIMQRKDWLERLFRLWSHGEPLSTLGPADSGEFLLQREDTLHTDDGLLGICTTNLRGAAMLIPKAVSDILGYWTEDYGLYSGDDGDYGLRMNAAGFPQYYYAGDEYFIDVGDGQNVNETYAGRVDRSAMHRALFVGESGGTGLFPLNHYLFNMCIRNWNVPLRYEVADISEDFRVKMVEREEYGAVAEALRRSKERVDAVTARDTDGIYESKFIQELKELWATIGQSCDGMSPQSSIPKNSG